jgi:hypothetical protein
MTADADAAGEAWYRNQWVWLVIAIPALTIAGCLLTIYLALANPDQLVRETAVEPGMQGDAGARQP